MWHWEIFRSPFTEKPQRLRSPTQTLKPSSTSCFKYFAIIKFKDKWQTNALDIVDLLAGPGICTWSIWSKPITAKEINLSISFLFFNSFLILKLNSKNSHRSCSLKKLSLKGSEYSQANTCVAEYLFDKVAGLQDYCKTYLLHAHLIFYFSLGKRFINFL